MNTETRNEVKKNVATGMSTAAGATAGVVIGAALSPEQAAAQEVSASETTPDAKLTPDPEPAKPEPAKPEPAKPETVKPVLEKPESVKPEESATTEPPKEEIEVIGYDRVTNDDGSQMDVAVLNVDGNEVRVVDFDLDGEADAFVCDVNQNGIVEEGEVEIVQGEGIAMQPMADAAGFNPQYAQNDLPDYVNDADVDTYMA